MTTTEVSRLRFAMFFHLSDYSLASRPCVASRQPVVISSASSSSIRP
jgi:hypothetical protein